MDKQPKSRGARWWLIAAILVLVVVCLVVFVYNLQAV